MNDIIDKIRDQLKESIDINTQVNSQRFFKEKIKCYGVKVPVINRISKDRFKDIKAFEKAEIFRLIEILWQSGSITAKFGWLNFC